MREEGWLTGEERGEEKHGREEGEEKGVRERNSE